MKSWNKNIITSRSMSIRPIDVINNIITSTSIPIPLIDLISRSIIISIQHVLIDLDIIDVINLYGVDLGEEVRHQDE